MYIKTELIFVIDVKSFRIVLLFFVSSCTIFTNYLIFIRILIIDYKLEKFFYKLLILKSIINICK